MIVEKLVCNQFGGFRSVDGNAEETLPEFLSGRRVTVLPGFRVRRVFRHGMDKPKPGLVCICDHSLGVAHCEAGVAFGVFIIVHDVHLLNGNKWNM